MRTRFATAAALLVLGPLGACSTIKEAVRRRLLLAFVTITMVIVGLSAWGFDRLSNSHNLTSGESNLAVPTALILFMFMFSFVLALSASAIASPSISSEIESGVLMTIVTGPRVAEFEKAHGLPSGSEITERLVKQLTAAARAGH